MAFTLFNAIATKVLTPLQAVTNVSSTLVTWVAPIFLLGVSLYVILYGLDVMRGAGGTQYVHELMLRVARPVLVWNLALAGGMYSSTLVGFCNELRTDLAAAFGAKGANSYAAIDAAIDNVLFTVHTMFPIADKNISFVPANVSGIIMYLCLAVVALGIIFYGVVACVNLLVIDASLAVVFGLGPLFVACLAWNVTSRFFDSWLSTVLKYVFTAALIALVVGIANGLITRFANSVKADSDAMDFITVALSMIGTSGLLVVLIGRASAIAADLTGGLGVTLATARQVASAGMAAAAPAAKASNALSYASGAAAGAAGRTNLGARVVHATQSMRDRWASASSGFKNFSNAVAGRSVDEIGRTTHGHGVANAYRAGRNATASSVGTGTISSGGRPDRPVPRSEWRD